jgi:hypothetical protein
VDAPADNGEATQISLGLVDPGNSYNNNMKSALYLDSDNSYIQTTDERMCDISNVKAWFDFTFSTKPEITDGTDYVIAGWATSATGLAALCYDSGAAGDGKSSGTVTYGTWPNPATLSAEARLYSSHCDYDLFGGGTTLNLWGTATLTFAINSVRAWNFYRLMSITETFSIGSTKAFNFNILGSATVTYGIGSLLVWQFSIKGLSSLTFSINSLRTWVFNLYGLTTLNYNILTTTQFLTGTILNLFGEAALTFTINAQKIMEFSIYGSAALTFNILSLIGGLVSVANIAQLALGLGMLGFIIALCALALVVSRKQKE